MSCCTKIPKALSRSMKRKIIILTILIVSILVIMQGFITYRLYREKNDFIRKVLNALPLNQRCGFIGQYSCLHGYIPSFIEEYLYPYQYSGIVESKETLFTDDDLCRLYDAKLSIKSVDFYKKGITAKGIASLSRWNYLEWLTFHGRNFSKEEFGALKKLKQLKCLSISNSNLTQGDELELKKVLPRCRVYIYNK